MKKWLIPCALALCSCTQDPMIWVSNNPEGGTFLNLGGSVLTKSAWEKKEITKGDIKMTVERTGKDEAPVLDHLTNKALINGVTPALNTGVKAIVP